jgi:hypothetical protein
VRSHSSRRRTSHYTTHARSRTSRISRKHSVVIVRPAQGRSSSDLVRRAVQADHCPMGTTLSRHPLVRPAPTRLLLAADSSSRSSRKATCNMQPRRTRKPPPQVAEDERSWDRPRTWAPSSRWHQESAHTHQRSPGSLRCQRSLPKRDGRAPRHPDRSRTQRKPASRDVNSQWLGDCHEMGD